MAAFKIAAKEAIAAGADVIVPAEGVLALLIIQSGIQNLTVAPVVDVFAAAWSYALMLSNLWSRTGLRVERKWHYRRDDVELIHLLHHPRS